MWKLIGKLLMALLNYWQERRREQEREQLRRRIELMDRDRGIDEEVEHAKQGEAERLAAEGASPDAYRDAFDRVRRLQQGP